MEKYQDYIIVVANQFQCGVDVLGMPIYVTHYTERKNIVTPEIRKSIKDFNSACIALGNSSNYIAKIFKNAVKIVWK